MQATDKGVEGKECRQVRRKEARQGSGRHDKQEGK
jgi:hypothetical protein